MPGPGRKPTVTDEEILEVFRVTSDPVLSTGEVAEQIGLGRRGTLDRLKQLTDENKLKSKKIGVKAAVWWSPDALQEQYTN